MKTELVKSHVRFVAVSEETSDRWAAYVLGVVLGVVLSYLLAVAFIAIFAP